MRFAEIENLFSGLKKTRNLFLPTTKWIQSTLS